MADPEKYERSDEAIGREICDLLIGNGQLNAGQIEVQVEQGVVTLTGMTNDESKQLAHEIAATVYGVKDVKNRIQVVEEQATESASAAGESTRPANLKEGQQVVGAQGQLAGTVKQVLTNDFVLLRPRGQDVRIPFEVVQETDGDLVHLTIPVDQIDQKNWPHI